MSADLSDLVDNSAVPVSADGAIAASVADAPVLVPEDPAPPTAEELADAQTPLEPDEARDEVERIDPDPTGPVTLVSGAKVEIVPLKLRETMKLLKIVTRGAGGVLEQTMGDLDLDDPAAFAQTFGALIVFSIPEAENEAVEFIQSMVLPYDFSNLPQQDKIDQLNALAVDLSNPELEDVISIIERVVRRESEDIRNLGKRISQAFQLTRKVQPKPPVAS